MATRLGEQALLVDLDAPFTGPFGASVQRIAIPHWMAGSIGRYDQPELLDRAERDLIAAMALGEASPAT